MKIQPKLVTARAAARLVPPKALERRERGHGVRDVFERSRIAPQANLARRGPDVRYFDGARAMAHMDGLVSKYPELASKLDLSSLPGAEKTHQGRSIVALKLTSGKGGSDKPAIVLAAQHHARELNCGYVACSIMEKLASSYGKDPAITKLLDEREVYIVPHVNPDGINMVWTGQPMWRKNLSANADGSSGTDLNRNYPFVWGGCGASTGGSSEVYDGKAPGSEPETRTMMALQRALRPELYIDLHNAGNEVLKLYADCAKVTSTISAFGKEYADRLRGPMAFEYRSPSGSGEAPQWHWSQGTLAYLIEIGTEFQPRFEDTLEDAEVVWKGVSQALTTWAPAARGHVTDQDGRPVAATFKVKQPLFELGETANSRTSDGRFSLWLPKGTWDIDVSAPGYVSQVVQVKVEAYDQPMSLNVQLKRATMYS